MDKITLNRIHKVGLELEGGWYSQPSEREPVRHDGSVQLSSYDPFGQGNMQPLYCSGEISNQPTRNMDKLETWVKQVYPPVINETCGLHVHVSFENIVHYQMLMDKRFYDYYLEQYDKWIEIAPISQREKAWFKARLDGINRYCIRQFVPDKQSHVTIRHDTHRYCHLNYCHTLHGTLESRLLPMFNKSYTAWAAIIKFIAIIETWLEKHMDECNKELALATVIQPMDDIETIHVAPIVINEYQTIWRPRIRSPIIDFDDIDSDLYIPNTPPTSAG